MASWFEERRQRRRRRERDRPGVERDPRVQVAWRRCVASLAEQRQTDVREVHPHLVRSPRGNRNLEERAPARLRNDPHVGPCRPAVRRDRDHATARRLAPRDRQRDREPLGVRFSPADRQVDLSSERWPHPTRGSLDERLPLGEQDRARSRGVELVHGPEHPTACKDQLRLEAVRIRQRPPGRGKARGLVRHDESVALPEDCRRRSTHAPLLHRGGEGRQRCRPVDG